MPPMGLGRAISSPNRAALAAGLKINLHLWITTQIYNFQCVHRQVGSNRKRGLIRNNSSQVNGKGLASAVLTFLDFRIPERDSTLKTVVALSTFFFFSAKIESKSKVNKKTCITCFPSRFSFLILNDLIKCH